METNTLVNAKSTHIVDTFLLVENMVSKHPNADTLSIIKIPQTEYTCIMKTSDAEQNINRLMCFLQPESLVDITRPEFSFLDKPRIKARKIRGVQSYGLLVLAPSGLNPGDNAAEALGVKHYDPEEEALINKKTGLSMKGDVAKAPTGVYPKYDVDNAMKYLKKVFNEQEIVYVSAKLHGANFRAVYQDNKMNCGSRNEWKKEFTSPPNITLEQLTQNIGDETKAKDVYQKQVVNFKPKKDLWWSALHPNVEKYCRGNPGYCVYGEVYGQVGGFPYDTNGVPTLRLFDILLPNGKWMDADIFMKTCKDNNLPIVPHIFTGPLVYDDFLKMIPERSVLNAKHIEEGLVIKPIKERWNPKFGRACLKLVSAAYLEK